MTITHETGTRIGPTGVFLGDPEPGSTEWVGLRLAGITGTDVAAIVGTSSHGNTRTVWHHKRGDVTERTLDADDPDDEAALWGVLSEPMVAHEWARRHKAYLAPGGIFGNVEHPWMRSQLDRLVAVCPDTDTQDTIVCALEVKTRNAFVAGTWRDDVPDDVLAQVAWQRMVTGFDHVHVACLIGGQRLVEHTYTADEPLESYLLGAAAELWLRVQNDDPPPVEWDKLMSELLDRLAPDRSGSRELSAVEYTELMTAWGARHVAEDLALRAKANAEGKIKNAMGAGDDAVEILTYQGDPVFTWKVSDRRAYSVEAGSYRALRGPRRG